MPLCSAVVGANPGVRKCVLNALNGPDVIAVTRNNLQHDELPSFLSVVRRWFRQLRRPASSSSAIAGVFVWHELWMKGKAPVEGHLVR